MRSKSIPLLLLLVAAGCASHHGHHRRDDADDTAVTERNLEDRPLARIDAVAVRPDHPRLMIGQPVPQDPTTARWQGILLTRGRELLAKPLVAYTPRALLTHSREALQHLSLLAGLYQMTHDPQWSAAARRELLNVCSFPDWQPNDFIATAEMMNAVAIAYDWTYDTLSPADRQIIQNAIISKGLTPAMAAYASRGGWTTAHHNWNLVCNGSVIVASLAISDVRPQPAQRALMFALNSIHNGLSAYDAQGGTAEGPMYHNYATRYLTFAAAALSTAPQSPVSLAAEDANWAKAGDYRTAMTGPTGKCANFGDCSEVVGNSAWMFWHAREFQRPDYAAFEAKIDANEPSIFDYFWYTPPGPGPLPPLIQPFGSAVVIRSRPAPPDSRDPNETFLAVRCGSTAGNHTHLDLGTFVLDMLGQRFAADLGADNYDLPGYLGARRGEYLRSSTPGHNTLSIAGASQPTDATAAAEIVPAGGGRSIVRIDMTSAYPGASHVIREIGVDPSGSVGITDTIKLFYPGPMVWNLHTPARVTPTRDGALLDAGGKRVQLRILEPAGARLTVEPDETDAPALPVEGMTHVRINLPPVTQSKLRVEFVTIVP